MILNHQSDRAWRWLALLAVIVNMIVYYSASAIPGLDVNVKYHNLIIPGSYAFFIWNVINVSLIVYALVQLFPSQRRNILYDQLAKPFILINMLSIVWANTYKLDLILLSLVILVVMFTASVSLYLKVRNVVLRNEFSNWLTVPFSMYSAWTFIMLITNFSTLLISQGWVGSLGTQLTLTMVMILSAGILGLFVSYRFADVIFTAVITWACIGIVVAHGREYYSIGAVALISASLPIAWFVLTLIKRVKYRHRVLANKFSFDDTMRLKLNSQNKLLFGRL